jgi:hypothetical protein
MNEGKKRLVVMSDPEFPELNGAIGLIIDNDEFWELTADQLREAIIEHGTGTNRPVVVARFLNGDYSLFDMKTGRLNGDFSRFGRLEVREENDGEWEQALADWREKKRKSERGVEKYKLHIVR